MVAGGCIDGSVVAAVVDEGPQTTTPEGFKVSKWARDFRCRLFEDNTGVPASEWQGLSIDESVKRWQQVAAEKDTRIEPFHFDLEKPDSANIPNYQIATDVDAVRLLADPDDQCSDLSANAKLSQQLVV